MATETTLSPQTTDSAPTKESIAAALNGTEYPPDAAISAISAAAKAAGLVIVYGASDDLMEFEGAIYDEIGAYDGTTAYLDRKGLLDRDQIDDNDDEAITDYTLRKRRAVSIEALWDPGDGYSWSFQTEIPHATFEVVEDGAPYCRGIVFALADLPEMPA